jgi:hypothetical protein
MSLMAKAISIKKHTVLLVFFARLQRYDGSCIARYARAIVPLSQTKIRPNPVYSFPAIA